MIEITIPKLGLTMENAVLASWQCKSGDEVKKDDILFIIETDKVSFEVPAPANGIVHPVALEGGTYGVGETVAYLAEDRKEYEEIVREFPAGEKPSLERPQPAKFLATASKAPSFEPTEAPKEGRLKASPLARAMASSHNLDLSTIKGSGPGGRIVRADILRAKEEKEARLGKGIAGLPRGEEKAAMDKDILETIPVKGMRRAIFANMYQSLSESAQLTLHTEASAEGIVRLRLRLNSSREKISYNSILTKITATALRLHPDINASVDGNTIRVWRQIHIGLAMEADEGLIVPVTRNPDLKGIREIEREIDELIRKTREHRLSPDDLANGTFTITNLGFADIDHFTPIIRPPESAILGVGRITKKPTVRGEDIVPEARIGLSLTFDHRIIDGAPAARFLRTIKEMIEEPGLMIA